MKILVLSPYPGPIVEALNSAGDQAISLNDKISALMLERLRIDWLVSYGYRYLIREPLVSQWRDRSINLHISMLPFNRGADPNFWSWFDDTPKGVSIHQIDSGIDTGPVFVQQRIAFPEEGTLETSYWGLRREIESLFGRCWKSIRDGAMKPTAQVGQGTSHRRADIGPLLAQLPMGYQTPVASVRALGEMKRRPQ